MLCLFESSRLLDQAEVAVSSQKGGGLTSGMPLAGGITAPTWFGRNDGEGNENKRFLDRGRNLRVSLRVRMHSLLPHLFLQV